MSYITKNTTYCLKSYRQLTDLHRGKKVEKYQVLNWVHMKLDISLFTFFSLVLLISPALFIHSLFHFILRQFPKYCSFKQFLQSFLKSNKLILPVYWAGKILSASCSQLALIMKIPTWQPSAHWWLVASFIDLSHSHGLINQFIFDLDHVNKNQCAYLVQYDLMSHRIPTQLIFFQSFCDI